MASSTRAGRVRSDARCFAVRARRIRSANAPSHDGSCDGAAYRDLLP